MLRDSLTMSGQLRAQRIPIARAHCEREPRAAGLVLWQLVRLLIVPLLQPVLDDAQISIRCIQLCDRFTPQEPVSDQQRQHSAQLATL